MTATVFKGSLLAAAIFALALAGCGGGGDEKDTAADPDVVEALDQRADETARDPDAVPDEAGPEEAADAPAEEAQDAPGDEAETEAPPCTQPVAPEIGTECTSPAQCAVEYPRCFTEDTDTYDGETYVTWAGGACATAGGNDLICDIADPVDSCPDGMRCMLFYYFGSTPVYGCLDACFPDVPGTTPPRLTGTNCGCREEYACDINQSVCLPGCSNDRECCEVWIDENGDYGRDAGEVTLVTGCTNWCDDDPTADGAASYDCVNNGTAGAEAGDPCVHSSQCPAEGRCLDPTIEDSAGAVVAPGGYCLKDRCDAVGRGCAAAGGNCGNLGTDDDPFYTCVKACHTGDDPDGAGFPCRKTPAEEKMTCMPVFAGTPYLDTTGFDGYCWYGFFDTVVTAVDYATDCEDGADCRSPLGLGRCVRIAEGSTRAFCTATCNQNLAVNHDVCGAGGEGVCYLPSGACMPACTTPGAAPGANGCPETEPAVWACYATSAFTTKVFVADGVTMPAGFCFPKCTDNDWCAGAFTAGWTCNTTSGVCSAP